MNARSEAREAGAPGVLVTGDAWSQSRPATVNVLMTTADNPDGNNVYARPAGPIADVVRDLIRRTFDECRPNLAQRYPDATVTVMPDHSNRGRYRFTVWSHPLLVDDCDHLFPGPGTVDYVEDPRRCGECDRVIPDTADARSQR